MERTEGVAVLDSRMCVEIYFVFGSVEGRPWLDVLFIFLDGYREIVDTFSDRQL